MIKTRGEQLKFNERPFQKHYLLSFVFICNKRINKIQERGYLKYRHMSPLAKYII